MITAVKSSIQKFLQNRGYDLVPNENHGKRYPDVSDVKGLSLYRTPAGNFYVPKKSFTDVVAQAIRVGKVYEQEIVDEAGKHIKPGTIVLDVGANFGQMTVHFSKFAGDDGLVYSFEAQKLVFEVLKKNVEVNNRKNIRPIFGAVYNKAGVEMVMSEPDFKRFGSYGAYGVDATGGQNGKNVVTSLKIDDMEFDRPISLMKVDVQGCDLFAMQGAKETIRKHKMPIIFEFEQHFQEEFNTTFQDYVDFVHEINYKFVKPVNDFNFLIVPKEG